MVALANLSLLKMHFFESAFGVEEGAPSWMDIHAINPQVARNRQKHQRAERQARLTQKAGRVHGRKDATLAFEHYLVGDGVALANGATPADDSLQLLLELCMGGNYSAAGSLATGVPTTTSIPVTATQGTRFKANTLIMLEGTGPDGENEIRPIESVAGDTITLAIATTNAIGVGDNVWNGYNAYLDPSAVQTAQAQAIGDDADAIWLLTGITGGFRFANLLQLDDVARIAFELGAVHWEDDSATLAAGSFDGGAPLGTNEELEVHWNTHGVTTINQLAVSQLDIDPGLTWSTLHARGNADVEHAARKNITGLATTASFTADIDGAFLTAYEADTYKSLLVAFGQTAGQSWGIWLPRTRIDNVPPEGAHAEQLANQVTLEAYENDGDTTTARGRSPIVVTRL